MDRNTARETAKILGVMIGEIMEDHLDLALVSDPGAELWADRLANAGRDITALAAAADVIVRRIPGVSDEA